MNYFAYGSNMSLRRLGERVPSVQALGVCRLQRHDLRFHKSGRDGSAKCDAFFTGELAHSIHGVLFRIDERGKRALDRVEGLGAGYDEKIVSVVAGDNTAVEAVTYYATDIDDGLLPYHWYKHHVLVGALEMGLPPQQVERIRRTEAVADPDGERHARQLAIYETPALAPGVIHRQRGACKLSG